MNFTGVWDIIVGAMKDSIGMLVVAVVAGATAVKAVKSANKDKNEMAADNAAGDAAGAIITMLREEIVRMRGRLDNLELANDEMHAKVNQLTVENVQLRERLRHCEENHGNYFGSRAN